MHIAITDKIHNNSYEGTDIRWKNYNKTRQLKMNLEQKYKDLPSSSEVIQAMLKFHSQ